MDHFSYQNSKINEWCNKNMNFIAGTKNIWGGIGLLSICYRARICGIFVETIYKNSFCTDTVQTTA